MTNEELTVMAGLATELRDERKRVGKEIESEMRTLSARNEMATSANEDLKARCTDLMAERDEARRKLGALTLCVGFLKDYDTRHPKKSLKAFKVAVKRCIDDNHIVLTEGGMAK